MRAGRAIVLATLVCGIFFVPLSARGADFGGGEIGVAAGKGFSDDASIKTFCQNVLEKFVAKDIAGAFTLMRPRWILPPNEIDNLERLTIQQINMIMPRFGKPVAWEFVRKRSGGQSVVLFTYIVKHENHPIRFQFWFYKPREEWILNSFSWDDKLKELIVAE